MLYANCNNRMSILRDKEPVNSANCGEAIPPIPAESNPLIREMAANIHEISSSPGQHVDYVTEFVRASIGILQKHDSELSNNAAGHRREAESLEQQMKATQNQIARLERLFTK